MKLITGFYAAGVALLTIPAAALAGGIAYDCDTAADHFSELSLPAGGGPFKVTGKVQLNSLAVSSTFIPIARIQVVSAATPGHPPKMFAGFSISALPVDPKKMPSGEASIQMLSYNFNGKDDEILPLSLMTKPGTVQSFELSYDLSKVSVNLGNEAKSFLLKDADPVVRIVCSTGEFLFTDLTITPLR